MSAYVVDGMVIAREIFNELKEEISSNATAPCLAIVSIGCTDDTLKRIAAKKTLCSDLSIKTLDISLPCNVSREEVLAKVDELNMDRSVHGIVLEQPFPDSINIQDVVEKISRGKDVEGLHSSNIAQLTNTKVDWSAKRSAWDSPQSDYHAMCIPQACIEILDRLGIDIEGKDAVVVGRAHNVAVPLSLLLMHRNATVTIAHCCTRNLPAVIGRADILVSALGRPEFIKGAWLKPGATVIDLGTTRVNSTESTFKVVGDCEFSSCKSKAGFMTAPGQNNGIGTLAFYMVLRNLLNCTTAGPDTDSVDGAVDPYLRYGGAYLGDPKDTTNFKYVTFSEMPKFTDEHKSAMSRHLTPDLFNQLKDVKSSRGYTLSNVIMTGVVTPHLGVGATAGDESCWEVFKPLFNPIIKDWHGYDPETQTHPKDLDPSKLVFTEEQRKLFEDFVVSTRIRAARNISGYSLPAGTDDKDRAAVEAVLKQAFDGLDGELSGTYYELGDLTTEQRDFLLEKGFLFQIPSARNLLTGAGAARSWPNNRGIFHNSAQTALAWVNEEDHCRIISMEMGGDIPSVFTRFCALSDALEASAKRNGTELMWNERLGFLGTCPSNLGTGLRASVMIRLPEFNKLLEGGNQEDKELLDQVCSAYDLQPRGSAGEHSAAVGAKFDISNKQRLGFSEVQLVQKMIDGVSKVIEYETLLAQGVAPGDIRRRLSDSMADPYLRYGGAYLGDPKDTANFKYVTFSEMPKFTDEHKSAMSRHLTPDLFNQLKDVKSSRGYTLSNVIMTGVVTPHLGVGATAGDESCWEVFKPLFNPIIKDWHGYDPETQTHPKDLDPSKLVFTEEQRKLFEDFVVSTRIRAARNISGYSLPAGTDDKDRAAVEAVLKQAFDGLDGELSGTYYELGDLTTEQRDFLLEKGFLFQIPSARNLLTGAGAARSWPNNRGIFHNSAQTALAWVNEEDHCRIISMEMGGDIPSVFTRFCALSDALEASAKRNGTELMWNERLGFLGTCPSNLGTGLRASVMIRLPEFNKLLEGGNQEDKELLDQVCSAYDLQPRGSAGEHSAAVGAKFDISNKQRLGFSEVQLVQKMIDGVSKVIEYETLLAQGVAPGDIRRRLSDSMADPYLRYGGAYLGDPKDTANFKYVTFSEMPKFTDEHKSAMSRHLTPDLFNQLKDVKSSRGYTLSNVIMTGVVTPHLGVGATAGDESCWEVFKPLFNPIIKDWHGYDPETQTHPKDLDPSKLVFTEEQRKLFEDFVVSTRIRAARNISGYSLPAGTDDKDRAAVEAVLKQAFDGLDGELSGTYYELGDLTTEQRDFLLEKGFLFQIPSARNLLTGAGAARSWPNNRGIFHNSAQTALAWVNEEDHCRIISMEMGGDIPSVFTRFCALSDALEASAKRNGTELMWNERLGFLGTCPSNLGTGLRASVMIRLPEFNKLLEGGNQEDKELLDQVCSAYDLQPRGSAGEHSAAVGAKFDISNKQRLGFSEVQLVQKMIDGVSKVIEYETLLAQGVAPGDIRRRLSDSMADPYLRYGGAYLGDPKDTANFKYVTFSEMPKFTDEHKSAMSRHLTPDLFNQLKDVKSSRGYTLSNVIMTGVVTPHLGVGATAGDESCWEVFKPLFNPIIKDWHGYDPETQTHPKDLDPSKLVFTEEQRKLFEDFVVSTRIRAARNISGYSLPAGTDDKDRAAVEAVLKQAFDGLDGELSGTYYELGDLTTEQRDFLLEKGFLFQIPSARNLLTGAGAARSWPNNRGIFHNSAQTALAWVNEEDHCRIISMEMGGDIPSVFTRFCALSDALEASAKRNGTELMWNERLGFLGTCPSNLGTGLRASVMIRLPEFNKLLEGGNQEDKELLDQVCSAYDLQPRGSAGEHSAAVGAKFDISNKQRLGFSEVQLVQKMIDGVSKVIEYETLLAQGVAPGDIRRRLSDSMADPYLRYGGAYLGDPKDTANFKYVTFSEMPKFTDEHKSAMSRHLTPDLFNQLKDVKSSRGYTLSNVIMTGVVTPHLGVGATAGDESCWEVFKPLFNPIIKDWHGYDPETQTHPKDLDPSKLVFTEEQRKLFEDFVVSTRIRAARNISGYSLPAGTDDKDRAAVEAVLKQAFDGLDGELSGTYYELGDLTTEQRDFLLEKGFLFQIPSARNLLTGAGAARSWPNNRGIFHNSAQTALAWVNEEDHCRIISMEMGGDIPSVFTRFCALSDALEASAKRNGTELMWNERLGFLGTCPSNLGTGLRASVMIRLPEFNKLLEGGNQEDKELLDQVCSAYDLQPRGSAGEHSAAVGAKFDISNKQRLGFSEVQLVQKMIDGVSKVIEYEMLLAQGVAPGDIRNRF